MFEVCGFLENFSLDFIIKVLCRDLDAVSLLYVEVHMDGGVIKLC